MAYLATLVCSDLISLLVSVSIFAVIGWQFNDIQLEEIGSQDVVMVGVVKGDALTRVVNLVVSDMPGTAQSKKCYNTYYYNSSVVGTM